DFPGAIGLEKVQTVEQRAFPRSARTDDAHHLSSVHRQVDALQHMKNAIGFMQSGYLDQMRHLLLPRLAEPLHFEGVELATFLERLENTVDLREERFLVRMHIDADPAGVVGSGDPYALEIFVDQILQRRKIA